MKIPDKIISAAWNVIEGATNPFGLMASSTAKDNYSRVWSRDSVITGLAGIYNDHDKTIEALKISLINLQKYQSTHGQIPSNITCEENSKVSYGKLAGRVDATSWWIIGVASYGLHSNDKEFINEMLPAVEKAFQTLEVWEMNSRGLIYTPLSGNWADEYISEGYVLYDQLLRIWALRLCYKLYKKNEFNSKEKFYSKLILDNFHSKSTTADYHPSAFKKLKDNNDAHLWFSLNANGYDTRFDMAANAIALLLQLHPEPEKLEIYLAELASESGSWMLPVFYPVIKQDDPKWDLLSSNYSFSFKNKPHHFHNGGSWPVFLGMLVLGLKSNGLTKVAESISHALVQSLEAESNGNFHEYWSTDLYVPSGNTNMCFTASGVLFIDAISKLDQLSFYKYFL